MRLVRLSVLHKIDHVTDGAAFALAGSAEARRRPRLRDRERDLRDRDVSKRRRPRSRISSVWSTNGSTTAFACIGWRRISSCSLAIHRRET